MQDERKVTTAENRYCNIRATTLEEILSVCERHIGNIQRVQVDYHTECDGTPIDDFYCDMFERTWRDLRDDVREMIEKSRLAKDVMREEGAV